VKLKDNCGGYIPVAFGRTGGSGWTGGTGCIGGGNVMPPFETKAHKAYLSCQNLKVFRSSRKHRPPGGLFSNGGSSQDIYQHSNCPFVSANKALLIFGFNFRF